MKITAFGTKIRIGRVTEFETGGEQSEMADDELVVIDLCWIFFSVQTSRQFNDLKLPVLIFVDFS